MIANKYTILSKIGSGQFSNVFKGKFNKTDELVAIKTENIETPIPLLKHETRILNYINSKQSYQIPFIYWYGIYEGSPTLIMPFYEMSLEELYKNKGVSKKQHFTNIVKIIEILSFIHECGVIHCDVKPENFMIKDEKIYLIDFGLSTIFVDEHMNPLPEKNDSVFITGTPKFISLNIHNGIASSRRDDLISAIYIFVYLSNKKLPWLNVQDKQDGYSPNHIYHFKNIERKRLKEEFFNNIPSTHYVKKILSYLMNIAFDEKPHYQWMISIFQEEISKHDIC